MRPSSFRRLQSIFYGSVSILTAGITLVALPLIDGLSSGMGFALYLGISVLIIAAIRLGAALLVAREEIGAEQRARWKEEINADLLEISSKKKSSLRWAVAQWLAYSSVARVHLELMKAKRRGLR